MCTKSGAQTTFEKWGAQPLQSHRKHLQIVRPRPRPSQLLSSQVALSNWELSYCNQGHDLYHARWLKMPIGLHAYNLEAFFFSLAYTLVNALFLSVTPSPLCLPTWTLIYTCNKWTRPSPTFFCILQAIRHAKTGQWQLRSENTASTSKDSIIQFS